MQESSHFNFGGISSKEMGVRIATTSKGLFEETFLPTRNIIEKEVTHREKPYLQRVENEPLSFSLGFFIEEWDKPDSLRKIARWLFQSYYKPLIMDANPNRIFYVIFEGDSKLFHNGAKEGYVELNVRADSPYSYTAERNTENIKFRTTDTATIVENSGTDFTGEMNNTVLTSNGVTIDKVVNSWGDLVKNKKKWGELL
ncbi:phage tail protein [Sporosarcina sp. FSL W7-1283]|uniref:phage tail protein n=1 Tax=Sporosarcina sp. FSL W7-1283 TaxID=2921560 RepID=UPI0030FAE047